MGEILKVIADPLLLACFGLSFSFCLTAHLLVEYLAVWREGIALTLRYAVGVGLCIGMPLALWAAHNTDKNALHTLGAFAVLTVGAGGGTLAGYAIDAIICSKARGEDLADRGVPDGAP